MVYSAGEVDRQQGKPTIPHCMRALSEEARTPALLSKLLSKSLHQDFISKPEQLCRGKRLQPPPGQQYARHKHDEEPRTFCLREHLQIVVCRVAPKQRGSIPHWTPEVIKASG